MPPDTVKVSRPGPWGNPFAVGVHGTLAECEQLYRALVEGYVCLSTDRACVEAQERALANLRAFLPALRGKHLACWCPLTADCHADELLKLANGKRPRCVPMAPLDGGRADYERPDGSRWHWVKRGRTWRREEIPA